MKRMLTFIVLILVVAAGFYAAYAFQRHSQVVRPVGNTVTTPTKTFESEELGIAFEYSESYELREENASKGGEMHMQLVLISKSALGEVPQNGEGPTSITIEVFSNHEDKSAEDWVRTVSFSNFPLSTDKQLSQRIIGGLQGSAYTWDGLYRGESIAVKHEDKIILFSVTSLTPEDDIRAEFKKILSTVRFI